MSETNFRKQFKISAIVHVLLVVILIVLSFAVKCQIKKRPREMITYVDLQVAMPDTPVIQPVEEVKMPESKPEPKPVPEKVPEPPKKEKPVLKKPSEIKKSTKKIKKNNTPVKKEPELTPEEIKKLLAAGARVSDKTVIPEETEIPSWYYALVRQTMYEAWTQPGSLAATAGMVTTVMIHVQRNGTITSRMMMRSSGNALMDESVMKAVNAVSQLKPLPSSFKGSSVDITIEFELTQ